MSPTPVKAPGADVDPRDASASYDREAVGRLYLSLGRVTRLVRRHAGGMAAGQLSALATLVAHGPMRAGDLAAREGVAAPTLSRIVASLETQGYVDRAADPADGRSVVLSASPAGAEALARVRAQRTDLLAERLERLTPKQRRALLAAVDALEALAED